MVLIQVGIGVLLMVGIFIAFQINALKTKSSSSSFSRQQLDDLNALKEVMRADVLNFQKSNTSVLMEMQNKLMQSQMKLNQQMFDNFNGLTEKLVYHLDQNGKKNEAAFMRLKEDMAQQLHLFKDTFSQSIERFGAQQKAKFEDMEVQQEKLMKSTEERLEQMRATVDEKLHKTLEERLGHSFKMVNDQLQLVQKGLGEMQNLATGVGDLKKVLTNVKTRGVLGEIQLGNILEQILSPEQYDANVKTKLGSNDLVEFAIKLPGKEDGKWVYLPIDAKFPQEDYIRVQEAAQKGDKKGVEMAQKALVMSIKRFAKDIHSKYVDPPHTTDFAVLFLPIEGLYAEIVRQPGLLEFLQREYKIIITGPTTLAAMLNSLQMGFKTLAIQKRSSEVWNTLSAVKTEFGKFGGVLAKAQKKINEANGELDKLITTRTNQINRKLKEVGELNTAESEELLFTDTSAGTMNIE